MHRTSRAILVWLVAAGSLTAAAHLARQAAGQPGLVLSLLPSPGSGLPAPPPRRVTSVDARDLRGDRHGPASPVSARWDGVWRVPERGTYKVLTQSDGAVSVSVDGEEVFSSRPGARSRGAVDLEPGFHALAVEYEVSGRPAKLRIVWSRAGEARRLLDDAELFAAIPSSREQAWGRWAAILRRLALAAWLLPPLALGLVAAARRARTGRWPDGWLPSWWRSAAGRRLRSALSVALPAIVVIYAAALRFEALVGRYSWEGPPWARQAERALGALHPASLRWHPAEEGYSGDPYNYLRRAREMRGFYEPDAREPLFPTVTRGLLRFLDGRPLAVNAASALFSTLAVLATYLLGVCAFSRGVGLGAALVMAVDRDMLWWGVEGFRDDAFTAFVILSATALLRVRQRPSVLGGVLAGLTGAGACLTRITSLAFLIPAHAWLALGRGEEAAARRKALALSMVVLAVVVGPYMLSCALAYGDPFYAVNFHTKFYRSRSGIAHEAPMTWMEYLGTSFRSAQLAETGLIGVTTYPFLNKWQGLDYLSPLLGHALAIAAVAGLALFLGSPQGRLLLVVLFTALLPYAFTWAVPGGAEWRFTMHAYPFYAIAAALTVVQAPALAHRAWAWVVGLRLSGGCGFRG